MCGIIGLVNWGDRDILEHMTDLMIHRGPDDCGVYETTLAGGGWVGLGSRRLAILDLSPAGHMPMSNADGTLWITYNGEVYNHRQLRAELEARGCRFRSNSDTEVILYLYQEYGPDCVRRLNGIFALAIWDAQREQLFVARDHFGVKPLYYTQQGRQLAVVSEVKALLALPGFEVAVNLKALDQYLTFLWVPGPLTLFQDVYRLPPGHYAIFRDGQMTLTCYWDMQFPAADANYGCWDEAELASEIRRRFRQSVEAQMISDVPIGAFLSAGLDSSSIVAMMAQASAQPVKTYTITFPERARRGELTIDDPAVAARTARHFGCDHHELVIEPDVAGLLPRLVWQMDEPAADPALIMAYLVAREARRDVTVLLSGVGGDEVFGGYRKYEAYYWMQAYQRLPRAVRGVLEPAVLRLPSLRGTPLKGLMRLTQKMMRSGSLPPQDAFLMNATYLKVGQRRGLYTSALQAEVAGFDSWARHREHFSQVAGADFLNQMLYVDMKTFMVCLNLTYNDKMTMATSVEGRVPFLDRELAEFVAQHVPPRLKIKGTWRPITKYIFRRAMQGVVPDEVLHQAKAGFGAPVDRWLARDLRPMVDDLLSARRLAQRGYFEPAAVRRMIDEQRSGRHDWSMQIWLLLTLEIWLQTFVDRRGEVG